MANDPITNAAKKGGKILQNFSKKAFSGLGELAGAAGFFTADVNKAASELERTFFQTASDVEGFRIEIQKTFSKDSSFARGIIEGIHRQSNALWLQGANVKDLTEGYVTLAKEANFTHTDTFVKGTANFNHLLFVQKQLGVSYSDSTKLINTLTTSYDLNSKEVFGLSERLAKFGQNTGQSTVRILKDFDSTVKALSYDLRDLKADSAIKQFAKMQTVMRRAGEDGNKLLGMAEKFDSFEGLKFGGQLNMILSQFGSSFDAATAMQMDLPDRMAYFTQQFRKASGGIMKMQNSNARRLVMKQLAETSQMDISSLRAIMTGKSATQIQRGFRERLPSSMASRGVLDQLSMDATTRRQRIQQQGDVMVPLAVRAEKIGQQLSVNIVSAVRTGLPAIAKIIGDTAAKFIPDTVKNLAVQLENFVAGRYEGLKGGLKGSGAMMSTSAINIGKGGSVSADEIRVNRVVDKEGKKKEEQKQNVSQKIQQEQLDALKQILAGTYEVKDAIGKEPKNPARRKPGLQNATDSTNK